MKFTTTLISIAAVAIGTGSAQNATSTITITPGCPSAAPADVMVTRSGVPVPSCAAGNETVTMMSMPSNMSGSATTTGGSAQFTGAANTNGAKGVAVLVGGVFAALFV